jgi:hypothetical protein
VLPSRARQCPQRHGAAAPKKNEFASFTDFKESRCKSIHTDNRRSEQRLRVFKAGTIEFGGAGIDCTVRNIMAKGATLDVASPVGIPHEITLYVPASQQRRHGHIVWRKEKRIGVGVRLRRRLVFV